MTAERRDMRLVSMRVRRAWRATSGVGVPGPGNVLWNRR